jgi:hypothetical protein
MAVALWKSTAGTAQMNGPAEFVGPGQGSFVNALVIGEDTRAYTHVSVPGTIDYFSFYVETNDRLTASTLTHDPGADDGLVHRRGRQRARQRE